METIGLIGLGTMGENLLQNFVSRDISVIVWNRTISKSHELAEKLGDKVIPTETLSELVSTLDSRRSTPEEAIHVFLLVPAGKVTNDIAAELLGIIKSGDAIWDLGNAHWDTTIANQKKATEHGIHWIGCGISGGSEGAKLGPSLMPGGEEDVIKGMLPILEKIAAKDFAGKPCVTFVGRAAAGNFVKMVHNGIEYAIMQGIAEVYDMLRFAEMPQSEIQKVFQELNSGLLKSFLLDITVDILGTLDPSPPVKGDEEGVNLTQREGRGGGFNDEFLLSKISDKAGSKGTGGWTVEAALKLGVPVPSIVEALFARWMSGKNHSFQLPKDENWYAYTEKDIHSTPRLRSALMMVYLGSYLQGLDLIAAAEKEFKWGINIVEILRIWQGGCIIRSQMLEILPEFLTNNNQHTEIEGKCIEDHVSEMRGINISDQPTPVIDATHNYLQSFFVDTLPTNLIQAIRDSFGAHGVKRIGSESNESFRWK